MDETNTSFEEFDAAFNDADEYQDDAAETVETEEATDNDLDEASDPANEDPEEEENPESSEDPAAERGEEPEVFTLKVNKEERNVSREEVITLAQKGADYDRVKDQLAESKNTVQQMEATLAEYQPAIDVLKMMASSANKSIEQIAEDIHLNLLMKDGKSEAEARAELRALKAEGKLKAANDKEAARKSADDDSKARADREIAEFRKRFPNVELSKELCEELMPDVQAGASLTEAYLKREVSKRDAEIAEIKRKQDADRQNQKNRASTPGSQRDSGGRREKSDFDDFMSAFE